MISARHTLPALFVLSLLSGCTTLETWDAGFPKNASELPTKGQRQREYDKFKISEVTERYVTISDRHYTRESFEPIFRHAAPLSLAAIESGDDSTGLTLALSSALLGTASYAIPNGLPVAVTVARDVVTGLGYGVLGYESYASRSDYELARLAFLKALAQRLKVEETQ